MSGLHVPISVHLCPYKRISNTRLEAVYLTVPDIMRERFSSLRNLWLCHSDLYCGWAVTQTIPRSPRKEERWSEGSLHCDGLWNILFLRMEEGEEEKTGGRKKNNNVALGRLNSEEIEEPCVDLPGRRADLRRPRFRCAWNPFRGECRLINVSLSLFV